MVWPLSWSVETRKDGSSFASFDRARPSFLVGLGLRLDRDGDDRLGELHALQDDRMGRITERVAGADVLETGQGDDVAGIGLLDVLAVVRMHQEHAADALLLVAGRVDDALAGFDLAGIDAAEGDRADEGVVHDLEGEHREGILVRRIADGGLFGLEIDAFDRAAIDRRRQEVDDGVEQGLHALVLEGRTAEHGMEGAALHGRADQLAQGRGIRLGAFEIGFHRGVVHLDGGLDELVAVLGRLVGEIGRDVLLLEGRAERLAVPDDRLHLDQVDDAGEVGLRADRNLQADGLAGDAVDDVLDAAIEIGADLVHLVDEHDTRDVVLVGLAPDGLGLGLDALVAVENADGAIEHAQRTLDLDGEVDVAGGVDDVQAVVLPEAGRRSRGDRDATLLLLRHPVHRSGAVMDFADLMGLAGVVEDALGRRRLARIDVGHDAEVAITLDGMGTGHDRVS